MLKYIVFFLIVIPKITFAAEAASIVNELPEEMSFDWGYYIGKTHGIAIGNSDKKNKLMQFIEGYWRGLRHGYYIGRAEEIKPKNNCIGYKDFEKYIDIMVKAAENYPKEEFDKAIIKSFHDYAENKCAYK